MAPNGDAEEKNTQQDPKYRGVVVAVCSVNLLVGWGFSSCQFWFAVVYARGAAASGLVKMTDRYFPPNLQNAPEEESENRTRGV
jgi:hypothetical protein